VTDVIYCLPLLINSPQEDKDEEEEEEIEAWFCLRFSAKCSELTFQFHIFLHNTDIPKRSPVPTTPKSRLEDHMPVPC
jgi:hypothetical protein